MQQWFKNFFYYTPTERNGIFLLVGLLCIAVFVPLFIPFLQPKTTTDFTAYRNEIAAFEATLQINDAADNEEYANKYKNKYADKNNSFANRTPAQSFAFDPNTATEDDFVKLGLSPKTAATITKFRASGAKFRTADDFGKIYSIRPDDLARLKPLIRIAVAPDAKTTATAKPVAENFNFDPNIATEADFVKLGLSPKTAAAIANYRTKGGKFKTAADFKKIYGLPEADFTRLESFIKIAAAPTAAKPLVNSPLLQPNTNAAFTRKDKNPFLKVDINAATAEEWQQLPNIGAGYANRIITYREKLGGFLRPDQLKEVWALPDSVYKKVLPQLTLGTATLRKLKINTLAAADLKNHPYAGWKVANLIVSYREQHGKYKQASELRQALTAMPEAFDKIAPYCSFE
jgi:competence ComEA-like helix-hairpin-helix protein